MSRRLAFYDFDGTLVSSNVVHQYLWYARRAGSPLRVGLLVASAPLLKLTDMISRGAFNRLFYYQYKGMRREWLASNAPALFEEYLRAKLYPRAADLLAANRKEGFVNILLTGSLDFSIAPLATALGFDRVLANSIEFRSGVATGRMMEPILAGPEKAAAIARLCAEYNVESTQCRAYSDDLSDLPMLEAVGHPVAANPKPSLRAVAEQRGWPVVDLR